MSTDTTIVHMVISAASTETLLAELQSRGMSLGRPNSKTAAGDAAESKSNFEAFRAELDDIHKDIKSLHGRIDQQVHSPAALGERSIVDRVAVLENGIRDMNEALVVLNKRMNEPVAAMSRPTLDAVPSSTEGPNTTVWVSQKQAGAFLHLLKLPEGGFTLMACSNNIRQQYDLTAAEVDNLRRVLTAMMW